MQAKSLTVYIRSNVRWTYYDTRNMTQGSIIDILQKFNDANNRSYYRSIKILERKIAKTKNERDRPFTKNRSMQWNP